MMGAHTHTMASCHRSIAVDGLTDADAAAMNSLRHLIVAEDAFKAHTDRFGHRDNDPVYDYLDKALELARTHCRISLAIAGLDADRVGRVDL